MEMHEVELKYKRDYHDLNNSNRNLMQTCSNGKESGVCQVCFREYSCPSEEVFVNTQLTIC